VSSFDPVGFAASSLGAASRFQPFFPFGLILAKGTEYVIRYLTTFLI
jgi:hypothetical protein